MSEREAHLLGARSFEKAAIQLLLVALLQQPVLTAGGPKASPECLRISATTRLAHAKSSIVISAATCLAHQAHDVPRPVRKMSLQPVDEQVANLVWKAQENIMRALCTGSRDTCEDIFDFVIVDCRYQRCNQHAHRNTPRGQLFDNFEACFGRRYAGLHDALQVAIESRHADGNRAQVGGSELRKNVQVARD